MVSSELALPALLRSVRRNHVHQIRAQAIIALQALLLERRPHIAHLLRVKALLDDTAHKRRELRLLPLVLLGPEFAVHKVKALEGVVNFDAAEHVHAAVFAGVALDHGRLVDDVQLLAVGGDGELVAGYDSDDAKEGVVGFPAFGAAAGMVEGHIGVEGDFDGLRLALAAKLAAVAVVCLLLDAAVDEGVEFCGGHCFFALLLFEN